MLLEIDIKEDDLLAMGGGILDMLLLDRTTGENIIWATDDYAAMGDSYTFFQHITPELITGDKKNTIQPRVAKNEEKRKKRARKMAEVFTPAWVCNNMNNGVDEAWFKRKPVFNIVSEKSGLREWTPTTEKVTFPEGKTWQEYVSMGVIEITCGEAPYLCNRYDAVTGEYNQDVKYRIGMLDRKLRIVSENTKDSKEWILWAKVALRSTYGFEWQGDNLLLAREALFFTFEEHYIARFGEKKFNQNKMRMMPGAAYIISWNVWQMDGLTYGLPGYQPFVEEKKDKYVQLSLFSGDTKEKKRKPSPHERFCLIKDFLDGVNIHKATLCSKDFHDQSAPKQTFESIVNKTQQ